MSRRPTLSHPELLQQLDDINRKIKDGERLVAGWIALIGERQAEGSDVTVAHDMLHSFKTKLEAHRADRDLIQQMIVERALGRARRRDISGPFYAPDKGGGEQ